MFRFVSDHLKTKNKIGKGRFGTVFPYQKDPQDHKWVVKRIRAEDADALIPSLPEIVLGFSCDHPCIVPVKGYSIEKEPNRESFNIYMKLPRMKETLLDEFKERVRKNKPYSQEEIIRHFYSIASGLEYLHNKRIYHGDIKPNNLLLDENGALKIADVGIAKHVEEGDEYQTVTGEMGNYHYAAPEILGEERKNIKKQVLAKADIWSLGVIILELCVFNFRLLNLVHQEDARKKIEKYSESLKEKYQNALISLLTRILTFDPKERPDIATILNELEMNFSEILNQDLLTFRKPGLNIQINAGSQDQIQALNQQIQNFEAERKQWYEKISQIESDLFQQKQQHEQQIQFLVGQDNSKARQEQSQLEAENQTLNKKIEELQAQLSNQYQSYNQILADRDNKLKNYEENIRVWQQTNQIKYQNFEEEKRQLKKTLAQLEKSIPQQKQQFEEKLKTVEQKHAKILHEQKLLEQNLQERINQTTKELQKVNQEYKQTQNERDENLKMYQQYYQSLYQENETNKQRSKDLEQQLKTLNTEYLNYQEKVRQEKQPPKVFSQNGNVGSFPVKISAQQQRYEVDEDDDDDNDNDNEISIYYNQPVQMIDGFKRLF